MHFHWLEASSKMAAKTSHWLLYYQHRDVRPISYDVYGTNLHFKMTSRVVGNVRDLMNIHVLTTSMFSAINYLHKVDSVIGAVRFISVHLEVHEVHEGAFRITFVHGLYTIPIPCVARHFKPASPFISLCQMFMSQIQWCPLGTMEFLYTIKTDYELNRHPEQYEPHSLDSSLHIAW